MSSLLHWRFFLHRYLALLQTHQYVFVACTRDDIIGDDHFGVLLRTHAKVHEFRVALVQLLEGALGLHDQVSDQSGILHRGDLILGEGFHWDTYSYHVKHTRVTIEVDHNVADCAWLLH